MQVVRRSSSFFCRRSKFNDREGWRKRVLQECPIRINWAHVWLAIEFHNEHNRNAHIKPGIPLFPLLESEINVNFGLCLITQGIKLSSVCINANNYPLP